MASRLASETIRITLDGQSVELVPTLRAAMRLASRYVTFGALVQKITEGDTQAIADVIDEGSGRTSSLPLILTMIQHTGILRIIALLTPPLIDFVIALAGPAAEGDGTAKGGAPITFEAHHEQLFEIAAGFLGWPPAVAWSSTEAEILAAHKGAMTKLRMIYGSGNESSTAPKDDGLSLDQKTRLFFSPRAKADADRAAA